MKFWLKPVFLCVGGWAVKVCGCVWSGVVFLQHGDNVFIVKCLRCFLGGPLCVTALIMHHWEEMFMGIKGGAVFMDIS